MRIERSLPIVLVCLCRWAGLRNVVYMRAPDRTGREGRRDAADDDDSEYEEQANGVASL